MAFHRQQKIKKSKFQILLTLAVVAILGLTAWNAVRPAETMKVLTGSVVPAPTETGAPGPQGPVGPASVGPVGAVGKTGAAGKSITGPTGIAGLNGINGLSVTAVSCNPDSSWTFTLSDSTTLQASGPCMGTTGAQGPQGPPISGFTFHDMYGFPESCSPLSSGSSQFSCING